MKTWEQQFRNKFWNAGDKIRDKIVGWYFLPREEEQMVKFIKDLLKEQRRELTQSK